MIPGRAVGLSDTSHLGDESPPRPRARYVVWDVERGGTPDRTKRLRKREPPRKEYGLLVALAEDPEPGLQKGGPAP